MANFVGAFLQLKKEPRPLISTSASYLFISPCMEILPVKRIFYGASLKNEAVFPCKSRRISDQRWLILILGSIFICDRIGRFSSDRREGANDDSVKDFPCDC